MNGTETSIVPRESFNHKVTSGPFRAFVPSMKTLSVEAGLEVAKSDDAGSLKFFDEYGRNVSKDGWDTNIVLRKLRERCGETDGPNGKDKVPPR